MGRLIRKKNFVEIFRLKIFGRPYIVKTRGKPGKRKKKVD
jgi:hypothetical protein